MSSTKPCPHQLLYATAMYALLSGRSVAPPAAVSAIPSAPAAAAAHWIVPIPPEVAAAQGDLRIDCTGLYCPSGERTHQAPVSRRILKSEKR